MARSFWTSGHAAKQHSRMASNETSAAAYAGSPTIATSGPPNEPDAAAELSVYHCTRPRKPACIEKTNRPQSTVTLSPPASWLHRTPHGPDGTSTGPLELCEGLRREWTARDSFPLCCSDHDASCLHRCEVVRRRIGNELRHVRAMGVAHRRGDGVQSRIPWYRLVQSQDCNGRDATVPQLPNWTKNGIVRRLLPRRWS